MSVLVLSFLVLSLDYLLLRTYFLLARSLVFLHFAELFDMSFNLNNFRFLKFFVSSLVAYLGWAVSFLGFLVCGLPRLLAFRGLLDMGFDLNDSK